MSKTKEELLLKYRKANKQARLRIVEKAGYTSETAYLAYLMEADEIEDETDELDQVIAFDTTGSMSSFLSAVKAHVKDLIPKLFKENPKLKMKIVAFGDYCDMTSKNNFGKAYQESDLTDNQNELINFVTGAKSTSGGDSDEFYELVIKKITEETPWRKGSKRAVLLIADFDPHPLGYNFGGIITNNQIDWREEAKKSAKLGIQWDTLTCIPNHVETFYKPLSEITNGVSIPFKTSSKTQDAVFAATSVRGSKMSKRSFETSYLAAMDSGDEELIGTYKSLSTKL